MLLVFLFVIPGASTAQACPNWQLTGQQAQTDANGLWVPRSFNVTAGGNVNLGACGGISGTGWVITAPDFTIGYNALNLGRDLEIRVNGSCDTVLLVNDAGGTWHFSDDANGRDPSLRLPNAQSGSHDIWVGTYSQGNCAATMVMETFEPMRSVQDRLGAGQTVQLRNLEFAYDSARLSPRVRPALDDVGQAMSRFPNLRVLLRGHTDSVGGDRYNYSLSQQRAESVRQALIQWYGIAPFRIQTAGFGEREPIASNATPQGRARNRRVEVVPLR